MNDGVTNNPEVLAILDSLFQGTPKEVGIPAAVAMEALEALFGGSIEGGPKCNHKVRPTPNAPEVPKRAKAPVAPKMMTTFACELYDLKQSYRLDAALPGFTKDEIKLSCEGETLTISVKGKKKAQGLAFSEICKYEDLSRSFNMAPDANVGTLKASFKNGILCVTVSKIEKNTPVDIKIS